MGRNWLMHESLGLKPDWLGDIKLIPVKNSSILFHNVLSNIFLATGSKDIGRYFFKFCLSAFLYAGITIAFFPFSWKFRIFNT